MTTEELNALVALVNFERAEWEYGISRYEEAQWDPHTPTRKALYAEVEKRGLVEQS